MAQLTRIEKILVIKENEKNQMIAEWNEAVATFEKVGMKLYELLKQKEEYESLIKEKIQEGLSISSIRFYQSFIMNLEMQIMKQQKLVAEARAIMEKKEQLVLEKNIEVKKYVKLNEKQIAQLQEMLKAEENKWMDEISIQQYMNRGN